MKLRKNPPYGIVWLPLIAMGVAGGIGVTAGAGAAAYWNAREEYNRIKDYDGVSKYVEKTIQKINSGGEVTKEDLIIPNLLWMHPTNHRRALLQASWGLLSASTKLDGPDRQVLVNLAEKLWSDSTVASKDVLEPSDPKIQNPLTTATMALQPFGAVVETEVGWLNTHKSEILIADQVAFEAQFTPEKFIKDAITDTRDDIFLPFAILTGLVTGIRPKGLSQFKWNLIRYSIYAGVGLAGVGYVLSVGKPYVELLSKAKDQD